jgi:hypothetical protein
MVLQNNSYGGVVLQQLWCHRVMVMVLQEETM